MGKPLSPTTVRRTPFSACSEPRGRRSQSGQGKPLLKKKIASRGSKLLLGVVTMEAEKPVVRLVGMDGNAFLIIGLCRRAATKAGWPQEKTTAMVRQMMGAASYDNLLQIVMEHFDVE
jgi:hypothetical protein